MRKRSFSFPWKKYISALLIGILVFSQTVRVDFFDSALATSEDDYRDIVSIIVDETTYSQLQSKIKNYANNIQGYLGSTRVSLIIVKSGVEPARIASMNEKLYLEGEGNTKVTRLVGTILIGNIPIPMVVDDGEYFPSMYPYVDFVDKAFVYNSKSNVYETASQSSSQVVEADIWHGVINPAIGRNWSNADIYKISQFLDKTDSFYNKKDKFIPSTLPPRVFYYDGEYEAESVSMRSLFQYGLAINNAENLAYKRFTKYLLGDINKKLEDYDKTENAALNTLVQSKGETPHGSSFSPEVIASMPDIQTKVPIQTLLKDFQSIINKKTLSDAYANIHNAGRYNSGADVRADIGPIRMTILDEIARTTLKQANDAMMPKIDDDIRAVQANVDPQNQGWSEQASYYNLSRYEIERYDIAASDPCDGNQYITDKKTYTNYRFGNAISGSNAPESCSIARGGAFPASLPPGMLGKNVTVEANKAYDVHSVNVDINTLTSQDGRPANLHAQPGGLQCLQGPKIGTFWKNNSVLRIVQNNASSAKAVFDTVATPTGYSLPIYSLAGMKDNGGIPAPRLSDCQSNYQYVLRAPTVEQSYTCTVTTGNGESETYEFVSCEYGWPTENYWKDPGKGQKCSQKNDSGGYTCFTSHEAGSNIDLFSAYAEIYYNDPIRNPTSCIIGSVSLEGSTLGSSSKRGNKSTDPCMECYSGCEGGPDDEPQYIDLYEKRTYFFTKMQSPILRHISPTDAEIDAAENSGITKSLPVDMVRSVEYLWGHMKEGGLIVNGRTSEYRVLYPNFFSLGFGNNVASARSWLNSLGASQGWADGSIKYWGTGAYISTGSLEKIINARNWLTSDVTTKYKRAVETSLSYSQIDTSRELYQQVPQYPVTSSGYEIAYLGLSPFTPKSVGNPTATNIEREYELRRNEIEGINISEPHEQGDKNPYAESDKCGPPEGVDIFKWPAAIMCWMQTLLPPRIIAGSCGSNTIGGDNPSSSPLVSPPAGFSSGAVGMRNFYAGGKLTYSTERTHMNYGDSLAIDFEYTKDNKRLNLPADSYLELQITARDKNGSIIAPSDYERYFSLAPQKVTTTGAGGSFLITSKDKNVTITLQAKPSIILPGKEMPPFVGGSSDLITINISSEYLRIVPKRGDIEGYSFDTIQSGDITFIANVIEDTGTTPSATLDYLTVVDDVTGSIVYTGSFTSSSILPSKIRNTIGVYRIILRDTSGRAGEATLALTAGALDKIVISPVSPKIKKGSNTLVVIHLKDSKGNPISPDLNSVELKVTGGYLSDVNGKEETEMKIDSMDADIPLLVGSKTTGTISLTAKVGGVSSLPLTIPVLDDIKLKMIPPTASPLQVGGLPVKIRLEVQDVSNVRISGFNSVASIDIPQGVGTTDMTLIDIKDGSGSFVFTPGTRSGTHPVKLDIPGIGSVSSEVILTSGVPMYISHVENEKTNSIDFILNDRYGNIVRENLSGTGTFNATPFSFSFSNGIYSLHKDPGYYTLNVASLATSVISYTDDSGVHTSVGIPFYATYIADKVQKFDFLPDYNARYSVLYGDSYLREGEDILFDTSPKLSQSLAVTTLLDSPFAKEALATVFPGGRITLTDSLDDAIVEATVTLKSGGYPSVHLQEIVAQKSLGDIQYQFDNAKLTPCTSNCDVGLVGPEIRLIPNTGIGFEGKVEGTKLTLKNENIELFSIDKTGKMVLSEGVTLELLQDNPTEGLLLDILAGGSSIGEVVLYTNASLPVITSGNSINTPSISSSNQVTLEKVYHTSLNGAQVGYSFIIAGGVTRSIDEKKIGPRGVDSFALTHDTPGIGWGGNNKTLLSYAAGDTVGEATRWFHTYTMINMGDPVAHVDHDAPGTRVEGIDRTIGTQITSNLRSEVASYALRDMDNDTYEDIVTLDTDGYVSLYSNLRTRFRYRQDIAYVPDLVERGISLGDLAGDGYADIIGLDHSGSLVLIENSQRKMTRINMKLSGGASMPSGITDFKIFNMDNAGGDDIVYMNESGELGILYYNNSTNDFTKKIVDSTLGVTLPDLSSSKGGVIYFDGLPQIPSEEFGVTPEGSTSLDDTVLQSEVYHQFTQSSLDNTEYTPTDEINSYEGELQDDLGMDGDTLGSSVGSSLGSETSTYVKSQYAGVYDLDVTRSWEKVDKTNNTLHSGDQILAKIEIKNNGGARSNIKYLDTLSENLDASEVLTYRAYLKGSPPSGSDPLPPFTYVSDGDYDVMFEYDEIPAGGTLVFEYELRALPARPGELSVGLMEKLEAGDDAYGDIAFNGSTSCGADRLIWRSRSSREYDPRGTRSFTQPVIPPTLRSKIVDNQDEDGVKKSNGIPDSIDKAAPSLTDYNNLSKTTTSSSEPLVKWTTSSDKRIEIGFDSKAVDNINSMVKDMQDGLACGFGGGSCMSFPINWAPFAPGQSPSVFGYPLNELIPGEGKPLMSGLAWFQTTCGTSPCCLPGVYPAVSRGFGVGTCASSSYGGDGGVWDSSNFFRIYVTPTLTLGMGGAVCFGGPAKDAGVIPPHKLFGFVQGGNCIVTAKPMPFCKGDGTNSDGDVKGVSGLGSITDAWNAGSCRITSQNYGEVDDSKLTDDIVSYLRKSPGAPSRNDLYKTLSKRPAKSITTGPLLRIGGRSGGGTTEVGIEIDTSKPFTLGNIVKIKNGRVPAFPDFIMSWVNDQLNELINALFTAPNLIVVLPGAVGSNMQFDGNWQNFQKKFTDAYSSQSLENIKTQMGQAYNTNNVAPSIKTTGGTKTGLSQDFSKWQNNLLSGSAGKTIGQAQGGLASVRAAYKLIGQLPFITLRKQTVPINVPWILPRELDKYAKSLENYKKEYDDTLKNWCIVPDSPKCIQGKLTLNSSGFMSSISKNLSRIEEYKKFPAKLQKYVTWKQQYMSQILCNVDTIRQMLGGWIKDNGVRFRKWAELYVLIKAIAESWQPLIDVFRDTSRKCDVCHNQRNSTVDWKLKILSALLPSPPIMKFPRWPDIILDLSDIKLGINISVPDFKFNIKPIRLPSLPTLSLPDSPTASLTLPKLPILPAIPKLPDLPELPSLPKIVLPNLPPPPKIPKLFGSIEVAINIFKIYGTIKCFLNDTFLAPEGEVGDIIAHKTERQGTLDFDFLGIKFPNFTLPTVQELRVSTHVNFNIRSDFITEFAKQAVKPVNEFTTDIGRSMPSKIGNDIKIDNPIPDVNLTPGVYMSSTGEYLASLKEIQDIFDAESKILLDTSEFRDHILRELTIAGRDDERVSLQGELKKSEKESEQLTDTLLALHNKKFDVLTRYIQAEYDSTAELQNIIDMITDDGLGDMSASDIYGPSQLVSSDVSDETDRLLSEFDTLNTYTLPDDVGGQSYTRMNNSLNQLQGRMKQVADAGMYYVPPSSAGSVTDPSSGSIPDGYAPIYEGVFILTPSGIQTRLFDATEGLSSSERIEGVDIDKDGDKDYIFRLDGAIYIKYSTIYNPPGIKDYDIIESDLTTTSSLPGVPNFFHESYSTPKNLNISFQPNSPHDEKEWRIQMYDVYKEGNTPEHVIDLYVEEDEVSIPEDSEYGELSSIRSISLIGDKDSFQLLSPEITVISKDQNSNFTLSAGRKIYTGKDGAVINYLKDSEPRTVTLNKNKIYTFRDAITATITSGKLYVFSETQTRTLYKYSDDFIGMPMVSGMEMTVENGQFKISEKNTLGTSYTEFSKGSHYSLHSVGEISSEYSMTIPYSNGMYSARIERFDVPKSQRVYSNVVLFSPQSSNDSNAPIIDTPDIIRIPVYATGSIDLTRYVSEMNDYSVVFDEDIAKDTSGNGIPYDDFVTLGPKMKLKDDEILFEEQTTLSTYTALLKITDEGGNTAFKDLNIEIYAPIPQIESITEEGATGSLDEKFPDEPIHLFRVRPGQSIERITPSPIMSDKDGKFSNNEPVDNMSNISIRVSNGSTVAQISPKGIITGLAPGYGIQITPSTPTNPLRLDLVNPSNTTIYTQFMVLSESTPILSSGDYISGDAVVVSPNSGYISVKATMDDPSIPGGMYIVKEDTHDMVAVIAEDGNIYGSAITIQYSALDGYMLLTLSRGGTEIAKLHYKTSFFYTVK